MEPQTNTFYVVRIVRVFRGKAAGKPTEYSYVGRALYHGNQSYALRGWSGVARFKTITRAKRALNYTCVKEALECKSIKDYERIKRCREKGKRFHFDPRLSCRHEVEVLKVTERISYDEPEVIVSLPERSPLEQLARTAESAEDGNSFLILSQ